jgi:hypothetical protein
MKARKNQLRAVSLRMHPRISSIRDLSVRYEGQDELVRTRTPDISPQGMFINTSQRFPEGAILRVKFQLTLTGEEVEARGEVRYCSPGIGVGVEFTDISPESARAIQNEIDLSAKALRKASSGKPKARSSPRRASVGMAKAS